MMGDAADFSDAWLEAIERSTGNLGYHQIILNYLHSVPDELRSGPPTLAPPVRPGKQDARPIVRPGQQNSRNSQQNGNRGRRPNNGVPANPYVALANGFANLAVEDDDDVETYARQIGRDHGQANQRKTQVRYLIVRAECGHAECIRSNATAAGKNKEWSLVPVLWKEAYDLLNRTFIDIDIWSVIRLSASEQYPIPERLQDGHSYQLLNELFDGLEILRETTERERQDALRLLSKQLDYVRDKLDPLKDSRQEALTAIGQERWNNNPRPKMDYAERMRLLAKEQKELEAALEVLQELQLHVGF